MRSKAQSLGIHLLDNNAVEIAGVRILGCTLWTDFNLFGEGATRNAMKSAQGFLPDFQKLTDQGIRFTPSRSAELHAESASWLSTQLHSQFAGATVVITHHLPAMQSVSERFKTSLLSASFASYRNELIGLSTLWIHGHTHDSMDYQLNGTRVVCNPRGYSRTPGSQENRSFDSQLVIEI